MFAIVEIGGHQYKVAKDDVLYVNRLDTDVNKKVSFDRVLLVSKKDGQEVNVGTPVVEDVKVQATVLDHLKDDKVMVFKKKRRKGYKKKRGHRQPLTQIQITNINT